MNKVRQLLIGMAVVASLALAPSAQAAPVTVGVLSTAGLPATVGSAATLFNVTTNEPSAKLIAPVSGTIVRWRVTGFQGGPWYLRVLTPLGGTSYRGGPSSGPQIPASIATQTYSTNLPIQAGQTIAVQNTNGTDKIGYLAGGSYAFFSPPLSEGATGNSTPPNVGAQFTYNADILPAPQISTVGPNSGPLAGGTGVVIAGTDFTEVSAVKFGAQPAQSYAVGSENSITAIAPPGLSRGAVDVSVTTISGTAVLPGAFTYTACIAPDLVGKKLKGAKKRIRKAGCKVGKVKFLGGATAKTGRVTKQNPKAGKVLAAGSKVNIKLRP